MTYVSWAACYEGESDAAYFDVLIPRVMEAIVMTQGTRHADIAAAPAVRLRRREVDKVAHEACAAREAFHLIFIHGDTGGRGLAGRFGSEVDHRFLVAARLESDSDPSGASA